MSQEKINKNENPPKRKKFGGVMFLLIAVLIVIFYFKNNNAAINKKLILNEPTKITLKTEFDKLVEAKKIDTVYMHDDLPNILFTTKENTPVPQVDYKTNEGKVLKKLEKQSKAYKESKNKQAKAVFVYKTFNPKTIDFKDYLLSHNIQVIELPDPNKVQFIDTFLNTLITIIMYIVIFRILLFPRSKDSQIKDSDIPQITFDDIAGNQEAKEEMQFLVDFLKDPERAEKLGAKMPKGVLFYGPPGTGKTLLAKAIAGEAGVPFYEKSGTDFIDKYVGVGAQRVKSIFKTASKNAPSIIFIDEIDSVGSVRGSDLKEYDNTLNQLLVAMDGFSSNNGVIVIAATNRLDTLDPGLVRPGRFDRHIAINLPDKQDREALFEFYLKDKALSEDVDIQELAGISYNYSGAAIKSFVNEAALIATQKQKEVICKEDFDEAFVRTSFGAHPKKIDAGNKDTAKLISYHEAGHALITKLFTTAKVNKVTIIGTTNGAGGFTSFTPEKETILSKEDLYNKIRISYGGRIAEYLLFNKDDSKVTTGASNDLQQVSDILDILIREVGMFDSMLFKLSESEYSKEEVLQYKKELASELYNETLLCLESNIDLLHSVAEKLLEKETLNDEELTEIIKSKEIIVTKNML